MLALWIIIGLLSLFVIASMLPFSIHIQGEREDSFSYRTSFHWPWRLFGIGIRRDAQERYIQLLFGDRCLYERKSRKKAEKKKKKKEKTGGKKKVGFRALLRDRDILLNLAGTALRFFRDLFMCFRRPQLVGDIEIGFGDPAAMGIVSGFVYAVSRRGMILDDLRIKPDYVNATFTGEVDFRTGALPARIIAVIIKLLFRLPIIGLLRLIRRRRKAKKKEEVNQNGS